MALAGLFEFQESIRAALCLVLRETANLFRVYLRIALNSCFLIGSLLVELQLLDALLENLQVPLEPLGESLALGGLRSLEEHSLLSLASRTNHHQLSQAFFSIRPWPQQSDHRSLVLEQEAVVAIPDLIGQPKLLQVNPVSDLCKTQDYFLVVLFIGFF
jgi:hypothetical protein